MMLTEAMGMTEPDLQPWTALHQVKDVSQIDPSRTLPVFSSLPCEEILAFVVRRKPEVFCPEMTQHRNRRCRISVADVTTRRRIRNISHKPP